MKQYRTLCIFFISLLIFALMLAGCGGDEPAPTSTPEPTTEQAETAVPEPTEAPTNTPIPPTNTPAPTDTPEPTAVPEPEFALIPYENAETGIAMSYPDGWAENDLFGMLVFASSEELMASDNFESGAVTLISAGDLADFETDDPIAALEIAAESFGQGAELSFVGEPEEIEVNGLTGALVEISGIQDDVEIHGIITILIGEEQERGAAFFGITTEADQETFIPVFRAMVDTISLSTPEVATGEINLDNDLLNESSGFILYGDSVENTIDPNGRNIWNFIGLEGEVIDLTVVPDENLDAVVDILDASGTSILGAEVDDTFATETITGVTINESGDYFIVVRGFADSSGSYSLTLTESESSGTIDLPDDGTTAVYGEVQTGTVNDEDGAAIPFSGTKGEFVDIAVYRVSNEFDPVIDVLDSTGTSILEDGAVDKTFDNEFVRVVQLPEDGTYTVLVTGYDGSTGNFELVVALTNEGVADTIVLASDEITTADDLHAFPFSGNEGDPVTAVVEPWETGLDVVVGIYNDDTDELIEEIDGSTGDEALTYTLPETGNYYFTVSSFDGSLGGYNAKLIGSANTIFELARGDVTYGRFANNNSEINYWLAGDPGAEFTLIVQAYEDVDAVITVTDRDGNTLAEIDEAFTGEAETLTYTFDATNEVVIVKISEFLAGEGEFVLSIE